MLTKIHKIKNLGVFSNYTWPTTLPPFERYNVIYGDNGSGKTTLSRLLDCLKHGEHTEYPTLEFKIDTKSGEIIHGQKATRKVRVFNSDYVQLNIGQLDGSLKPILVIGEENKAAVETLAVEEAELEKRQLLISQSENNISSHQTARGRIFTAIARTISEATSGSTVRNYRKNNAEAAYASAENLTGLSEEELQTHRLTIRQDAMEALSLPQRLTAELDGKEMPIGQAATLLTNKSSSLCSRSAVSEAIQRLRDNSAIAKWVEEGCALHRQTGANNCEFCGQFVPAERWKQLEDHFSIEDEALKIELESAIEQADRLTNVLEHTAAPDRLALYSDLRERYDEKKSMWLAATASALDAIRAVRGRLNTKLASRNAAINFDVSLDLNALLATSNEAIEIVTAHNAKTNDFNNQKEIARRKIESHYLASIKGEVVEFDRLISVERDLIQAQRLGTPELNGISLTALEASIKEKRALISSAHKASDQLTTLLHTFLGRDELVFRSGEDGYRVHRQGKPARRLSEGERTAIAFIYFIVQLSDQDFLREDGVVVVDDPVSSLDASSIYQAFAFLKNAVKSAKQVFLLTHNFGFLRLLINWLNNVPRADGKKQFYMLICKADGSERRASLVALDKTLVDHPTEYHFLFKTLSAFRSDGTIAGCYHIPNIARKVLETFLDFHIPSRKPLYGKMAELPFDENKKTAIYKFANDLSHFTGHGFEPGLVQESQKNVAYLLEMIKELAPIHYDGMVEATSVA